MWPGGEGDSRCVDGSGLCPLHLHPHPSSTKSPDLGEGVPLSPSLDFWPVGSSDWWERMTQVCANQSWLAQG